jgi:hypothetical protein
MLADAFRALHGPRLHGFAMLVTLGDDGAAERAAGRALAAGAAEAAALRHPERAAAWLRARTLRDLKHWAPGASTPPATLPGALAGLGVDDGVYQGLAALSVGARAALVASAVERFAPIDIEIILGASPAATRRAVAEARDRYLRVAVNESSGRPAAPDGELTRRVQAVAARAMSGDGRRR